MSETWAWPMQITFRDGSKMAGMVTYEWREPEKAFLDHLDAHDCAIVADARFYGCPTAVRLFLKAPLPLLGAAEGAIA